LNSVVKPRAKGGLRLNRLHGSVLSQRHASQSVVEQSKTANKSAGAGKVKYPLSNLSTGGYKKHLPLTRMQRNSDEADGGGLREEAPSQDAGPQTDHKPPSSHMDLQPLQRHGLETRNHVRYASALDDRFPSSKYGPSSRRNQDTTTIASQQGGDELEPMFFQTQHQT
jgi:hypothetical protein